MAQTIKELKKENTELQEVVLFLVEQLMDKRFEQIDDLLDIMDRPQILAGHLLGSRKELKPV